MRKNCISSFKIKIFFHPLNFDSQFHDWVGIQAFCVHIKIHTFYKVTSKIFYERSKDRSNAYEGYSDHVLYNHDCGE